MLSLHLQDTKKFIAENKDMSFKKMIENNKEKGTKFQQKLESNEGFSLLLALVQFLLFTDILIMYFSKDRRALHDIMAKSYCIDLKTRRIESI